MVGNTNMKEELLNNLKNILNSAELVYNTGDYTSSTVLYFKALFCTLDFIILKKNLFIIYIVYESISSNDSSFNSDDSSNKSPKT